MLIIPAHVIIVLYKTYPCGQSSELAIFIFPFLLIRSTYFILLSHSSTYSNLSIIRFPLLYHFSVVTTRETAFSLLYWVPYHWIQHYNCLSFGPSYIIWTTFHFPSALISWNYWMLSYSEASMKKMKSWEVWRTSWVLKFTGLWQLLWWNCMSIIPVVGIQMEYWIYSQPV